MAPPPTITMHLYIINLPGILPLTLPAETTLLLHYYIGRLTHLFLLTVMCPLVLLLAGRLALLFLLTVKCQVFLRAGRLTQLFFLTVMVVVVFLRRRAGRLTLLLTVLFGIHSMGTAAVHVIFSDLPSTKLLPTTTTNLHNRTYYGNV